MNKSLILTILFCLYSLLAICKPIHTNRKSIAFGITVITHGFQPPNANPLKEGEWVLNMARAIKNKYGGKILTYKKQTGLFETLPNEPISEGETVLLFDWADESWFNIEGYSEAAGDALFAALIKSGLKLENLHFIGHSRGCVVTTEVVERLLSIGVNVDHVTNLDPHDWGGMSNLGMAIGSDFDNHPELDPIKSPIGWDHNNGVICWDGIHFSDTYWHQRGKEIDLDGRPVFGSYCERWYNVYHTDIHENG